MGCYGIAKYYYLLFIGLYIGSIFYCIGIPIKMPFYTC